ncbi:hypothetical protein [Phenylobacterium sp.]|uniref:hypothetical protein n=1 Tax=Phenylobacterium sp. TaxID=1871053 RepID=UPI002FCA0BD1
MATDVLRPTHRGLALEASGLPEIAAHSSAGSPRSLSVNQFIQSSALPELSLRSALDQEAEACARLVGVGAQKFLGSSVELHDLCAIDGNAAAGWPGR